MTDAVATEDASPDTNTISLWGITQQLDGEWSETPPRTVTGVRIDSRECQEGELFVGLAGEQTHGQKHLESAVEHGAVAAVVEDEQPSDLPQFVVDDSERTLQQLAIRHRQRCPDLYVIGVTGSCGKTTVKEMIAHLLEPKYEVGKTPGNYNNQLGLPLTLLNESGGDVLVTELGMNQPGEIEQLTDWAKPSLGIITHIGPAHLAGLGSVENIVEEKGDLLGGLPEDGLAVLPGWIEGRERLIEKSSVAPTILDTHNNPDHAVEWEKTQSGVSLRVDDMEAPLEFEAEHLVKDAAMAAVVALELGVVEPLVSRRLSRFQPLEGRGRTITIGGTKVIDDGYNANPDSFRAAIDRLADLPSPRLALVGDMKEMGEQANAYHRELGQQLSNLDDADVYFVGEFAEDIRSGFGDGTRLHTFVDVEELPEIDLSEYNSALVKASNAVGLNDVLDRWRDQS